MLMSVLMCVYALCPVMDCCLIYGVFLLHIQLIWYRFLSRVKWILKMNEEILVKGPISAKLSISLYSNTGKSGVDNYFWC